MTILFQCPYLNSEVELTDERESHILERHPDLLPNARALIETTLSEPDEVRRSTRFSSGRLFSRWFDILRGGKHVVVVVISDSASIDRHWIITAYIARRLSEGVPEWKRS